MKPPSLDSEYSLVPDGKNISLGDTLVEITKTVALQQIDGMGPRRLAQLIESEGSVQNIGHAALQSAALKSMPASGRRALSHFLQAPKRSLQWQFAERTVDWLERAGAKALTIGDRAFPEILRQLHDCPVLLYTNGQDEVLNKDSVSIVGTRKPTMEGDRFTRELAGELCRQGLVVVSGMARGIDTAAHQGAIDAGGQTVAVWATGLDRPYPASNQRLAKDILSNGCVMTEMALGTPSSPGLFPRRNRLVSGLSLGVIVAEAALPSGSLITAAYAAEQNRDVFAVPGSVYSQVSRGCHQLIKDGARLVESVDDVLEELNLIGRSLPENGASRAFNVQSLIDELSVELRQVYDLIQYEPTSFEVVAAELFQLKHPIMNSADALSAALVELELEGLIAVAGGLYHRRVKRPGS